MNVFLGKNDRRWHMIAWMFIDGKGIELLAYVIVLILYVAVKRHLWRKVCFEFSRSSQATFVLKHKMFPEFFRYGKLR